MSVQVLPYSPAEFNALVGPEKTNVYLASAGGDQLIADELQPIFEKYNLCDNFGLCLLHSHYDMNKNERFAELYNVATPWHIEDVKLVGGTLIPRCWKFTRHGATLVPVEYDFIPPGAQLPGQSKAEDILRANPKFIEELSQTLDKFNLRSVLGLRVWPGTGFIGFTEITTSRLTVTFPPSPIDENSIKTAWFFNPDFIKAKCICKCLEPHGIHSGKHEHRNVPME